MVITEKSAVDDFEAQRDEFTGRVFGSSLGFLDICNLYIGERLGFYAALNEMGPATSVQLAERTGTAERYVREWLEQQAVSSILEVADAALEPTERRYLLPLAHAEPLLDRDSLSYAAPMAQNCIAVVKPLPKLIESIRTGEGIPYSEYGQEARLAQDAMTRPMFHHLLTSAWLPAIPDVHARLQADPPARIADIGCGAGRSSIAIAKAYSRVHVDGFDTDEPSIELARENANREGVANRVTFHVQDAGDPAMAGQYALVVAFETIHDMAHPIEALQSMRRLAAGSGTVIVADERVGETFTAPGTDMERLFYGASIMFCLPTGLADKPSAGTGAVMRPGTLRRFALDAGFSDVDILPIDNVFWRFYRLTG